MTQPYKLGWFATSGTEEPFHYSDTWAKEDAGNSPRLIIAPSGRHISLIQDLLAAMRGPFGILYVLVASRGRMAPGRYQCPNPVSKRDVVTFLQSFRGFLEHDGRANVWIGASDSSSLIVYDRHDVLYAYGPLKEFGRMLRVKGYAETAKITFPDPHTHYYHDEFDVVEERLLKHWEWKHFPLRLGDES